MIIVMLLAWVIAQVQIIRQREKESEASPEKFDLVFYLKDNRIKLASGLVLSLCLSGVLFHVEGWLQEWVKNTFGFSLPVAILYFLIGLVPERILASVKQHTNGFLQPSQVTHKGVTYNRKSNG
ncbi:MAG TPA: hypothetical protein DCG19_03895 [Cryomorphaceae bacterium]|nr:hypothetical protein [Owenweeksia sp.]MBF97877.1 hypothetical protein [Owenweeksia sp.]HAD96522.1 hypothetical protein [Cryomorphaceae bacterium]HBF18468.1 hypothetical protein [Cryomorphaceae bacterium]|tara:strand:+ start:300 stop:671 length:372 start_codon:yes stop_codon:yes gene_type:complete